MVYALSLRVKIILCIKHLQAQASFLFSCSAYKCARFFFFFFFFFLFIFCINQTKLTGASQTKQISMLRPLDCYRYPHAGYASGQSSTNQMVGYNNSVRSHSHFVHQSSTCLSLVLCCHLRVKSCIAIFRNYVAIFAVVGGGGVRFILDFYFASKSYVYYSSSFCSGHSGCL